MSLKSAVEGGIAGVTTLELITQTLKNINGKSAHTNLFKNGNLQKRIKQTKKKKGLNETEHYLKLGADLLSSTAYLGLSKIGKRKNAVLKGGILGTAVGLGQVFLNKGEKNKIRKPGDASPLVYQQEDSPLTKALEVSLYTIGGMITGTIVEMVQSNKKKKRKK